MAVSDPLSTYKAKRNFTKTHEPAEGGRASEGTLAFVVQKHWATRLHYDLRLELGGTMKSWAIPKGPSFDPRDKRMAVQVEDHPISYASFEGDIAARQYGAGKVIIWDEGTWHPIGNPEQGLRDGHLKFCIHGRKLKGKWALIRIKGKGERQAPWLLIKEIDEWARSADAFNVVDEMPDRVERQPMAQASAVARRPILAPLPLTLAPQLATLVQGLPGNAQSWSYEIKFDGYRLLARIQGKSIQLLTRNGRDWTAKLGTLHRALVKLALPEGWYDGEIVVLNDQGKPDFGALQNAFGTDKTQNVTFFIFDLPYCDGYDLRNVPLDTRRQQLQSLLDRSNPDSHVRFSDAFDAQPASIWASACQMGLEGVIGKLRDSSYHCGRSTAWIKLKCRLRQEFVIGGWTNPKGSRTGLGALLLGVQDSNGDLVYAGNVGTGFSEQVLEDLRARLDGLSIQVSPFVHSSGIVGQPHWVKADLVAQITFAEWTQSHHIRHASFVSLSNDKKPGNFITPRGLQVTHGDRVIDDSTGVRKIDLVRYYALVGALMMPHLKHRPVSLVRAPSGIAGALFFQKHAQTQKLAGVEQLHHDPALNMGHPPMLEVVRREGLVSAAQWNMVEVHTTNAPVGAYGHPNRIVFDLDPGDGVDWPTLQRATEAVHIFLTQLGLPSFLKTSGGKGLHVVVPIKPVHSWAEAKDFSQAVVRHLAETLPALFVAKSGPKNRVGRIFIDYLRNGIGATTVSAWSARARPGLGISVPVAWSELGKLRCANPWNIRNVQSRLDTGNSPWDTYAQSAKTLARAIAALHPR